MISVIEMPTEELLVAWEQVECDNPEYTVWRRLAERLAASGYTWAQARFLGFNNPDPHGENHAHGYEAWVTLSGDATPDAFITKRVTIGGTYATQETPLTDIEAAWGRMVAWLNTSGYAYDSSRQYLEEHRFTPAQFALIRTEGRFDEPTMIMRLLMPVVKQ